MQKYEKHLSFLSEIFQFLEMKFSIYLNRHVFVMIDHSDVEHSYSGIYFVILLLLLLLLLCVCVCVRVRVRACVCDMKI